MQRKADKLIPELAKWNNGHGISLRSWISGIGQYDHAIGYTAIFWPNFVTYDGCIFREAPDPRKYVEWMKVCHNDKTKVESIMNHLHIADLFPNSKFKPTKEVIRYLGMVLKEMWSCKLATDFPALRAKIQLSGKDDPELSMFRITFFQSRKRKRNEKEGKG